ncbi:MAG: lipoyl domain-containing protein [Burkholderiaceae bacterium]
MIHRLQVPGPISDVEEVRVLQWHGEPGRAFAPDELIVEVETHKAVVELRAQQPCVLRAILCAEGDWARIGATLALASDDPDEPLPGAPDDAPPLAVAFEVT